MPGSRSSDGVSDTWRIVLHASLSKPALSAAAVLALAVASVAAGRVYELVMDVVWPPKQKTNKHPTTQKKQHALTLLAACATCVLAGQLAVRIMSPAATQPRRFLRPAAAWPAVLAAPYLIGLPARAMVATRILEAQVLPLLSALLSFAAIKAALAAALLTWLTRTPSRVIEAPRSTNDIVPQFLLNLPVFAILMACQVAIDFGLWNGDQPYYELVYDVAIMGDALAALLATMLAYALRRSRDDAVSPAIFD